MDDASRIRELYEQTLRPRLESLEELRRRLRSFVFKATIIVAIPGLAAFGSELIAAAVAPGWEVTIAWVSFLILSGAIVFAGIRYVVPAFTTHANYKARFKREIVSEIFKIVCPTANYEPFKSIAVEVFDAAGIFNARGGFSSDDRVRGTIGKVPFEAAEVRRAYSTRSGKSSTTHVVFEGFFFHIDFNKTLSGITFVDPEEARRTQLGERSGLQSVSFDNAEFEQAFKVHATNELEARDLLTAAMMENLLALRRRAKHPVFLGFKNNRVYIGVHYGRKLFEPRIARTTSVEALEEMAGHFAFAEFVIHQFELNTRIRTKDVDDSLLRQPDAPEHPLHTAALTSGNLTEAGLLEAVRSLGAAIGEEEDKSPAPRPLDSKIQVQDEGGVTTVSYGLPISFFVVLAVSAACAVVLVSALHALSWSADFDPLAQIVPMAPQLAPLQTFVREFPLPVAIGAAVLGSFLALWWATRVRRVVVTREAIRIYRGLRPIPRRYERPVYGRVIRIDKAVYVGKRNSASLINSTASPILRSEDEARWIASELRRALHQTGHT